MEQSKKSFLKNMVGFSMMTWITFVIGFIASPIGTRLFTPEEMGKINMFNTLASLFGSLCYLGLDQAFVRFFLEPPAGSSRKGLVTFCAATSVGFGVLSSLGLSLGWRAISARVTGTADAGVFVCLCVFSVSNVLFRYLSLCFRMEQNARWYTVQGVLQALLCKIAYLAIGFGDASARPAILLLTALMGLFTLCYAVLERKRFALGALREVSKPFVKEISLFAAPLIPLTVITWLNSSMSTVILDELLSKSAVGIYTSALGLASSINIIQTGFNAYWAPYVYENYKTDNKRRFYTVHRLMACLLTGFGLTVTLLQTPVFLLLGKSFRGSVVFFPFLFLSPICYCLSETTGMGIGISKKSYWNTIIFLVSAAANIALCYLLIPPMGATGAAVASAASAMISLGMRTVVGERYYKAITNYKYAAYTVGLMLAASGANLLLADQAALKYAALLAIYALALVLFRKELKTLWQTAVQVWHEGAGALKKKAGGTP
ncbi:MAG: lipopolysaccharide biosynthesis protein [Eubacteriales bacterium]|nr:lipopolysaccharide biosynthesis protein [Eubacteriales bacterium]